MEENLINDDDTESMGSNGSTESMLNFLSEQYSPSELLEVSEEVKDFVKLVPTLDVEPSNNQDVPGERDDFGFGVVTQDPIVNHIPVPNLETSSDFMCTDENNKNEMELQDAFENITLEDPTERRVQQEKGKQITETEHQIGSEKPSTLKISSIHRRRKDEKKEQAKTEQKKQNDAENSRAYTKRIRKETLDLSDYLKIFRYDWDENNGSWTSNPFCIIHKNVLNKYRREEDHEPQWTLSDILTNRIDMIFKNAKLVAPIASAIINNLAEQRDEAKRKFEPFKSKTCPPDKNKKSYASGRSRHKSRMILKTLRHDVTDIIYKFRKVYSREMNASMSSNILQVNSTI